MPLYVQYHSHYKGKDILFPSLPKNFSLIYTSLPTTFGIMSLPLAPYFLSDLQGQQCTLLLNVTGTSESFSWASLIR